MRSSSTTDADADEIRREIIAAVAEHEGVSPIELRPALGDAVDIDAIGRLLHRSPADVRVRFRYGGLEIAATAAGDIAVREESAEA